MKKLILTMLVCISFISFSYGQVIISLLLGDKLNSENLEFGLDGGAVFNNISNIPGAKSSLGFNLGFYFDFKLKESPLYIHTGVIVKSPVGARGLAPYAIGDEALDSILTAGSVERNLRYFNVPVLLKYRFYKYFFVEAGPMVGLLNKGKDEFVVNIKDEDDLEFTNDIKSEYKKLDFGFMGGLGYKLMQGKGMSLGIRYYAGVVDVLKDNPGEAQRNAAFYIFAGIPIGVKNKNVSDKDEVTK
jgi:hypothetical protein